ncbi:FKBP-type peptidyl-prolyl cis-trans isomerase [Pelagibaculum spongiae]|uniref:Peptidyl-prolyl cis-trans isomerase n=1 Tax=Pelagibaculum spongiae TaxID=2080658 RepID=A0A2V1H1B6_9GAMM|nr:FKBP-type peptidyl-prolyl cis-trans isomerase [Pelagibaculum spongiae]PVZ70222.1 peptidylprolyl isomerase [Pelagibaculum spongiae]
MSEYNTVEERVSYGIGRQVGDQLADNPIEGLSIDAVLSGLADRLNDVESPVAPEKMQEAFEEIHQRIEAKQKTEAAAKVGEGEKFLVENGQREGIITTESGLQYEVQSEGTGEKPTAEATVKVHYHGSLLNGQVFDSSVERGEPATFPVNRVIAGWTEALQLMPVGSKWRLYVPHNLAYGAQGAGGAIGPYETLIFDVELIDIEA